MAQNIISCLPEGYRTVVENLNIRPIMFYSGSILNDLGLCPPL